MKQFITTASLAFCLLLGSTTVSAQQTVYQTTGPNGPVFSNVPQPGAKVIELRPLNVIDSTTLIGRGAAEKGAGAPGQNKAGTGKTANESKTSEKEAPGTYRGFAILAPENNESIVGNSGVFEVRVAVDPALRLGEGHAFAVSINGQPVGQRFTATEFMIPPEFWGSQLPPPNQRFQLGAAVVDRNGLILKEAAPVQFQLRYIAAQALPQKAKPQPPTKPEAQKKPATERRLDSQSTSESPRYSGAR